MLLKSIMQLGLNPMGFMGTYPGIRTLIIQDAWITRTTSVADVTPTVILKST